MTAFMRTVALTVLSAFAVLTAPVFGQASAQDAEAFVSENAQEVISSLQALDAGERQLDAVRAD